MIWPFPLLSSIKFAGYAMALSLAFYGGIVWERDDFLQFKIDQLSYDLKAAQEQARKDREILVERDRKLAEAVQNGTQWRQRYKSALKAPEVRSWVDTPHPPAVGQLLNSP